jgi:hypothetical protein
MSFALYGSRSEQRLISHRDRRERREGLLSVVFKPLRAHSFRQFVASEPRLSEAVAVYKESGFEVHLEPLPSGGESEILPLIDSRDGCAKCFEGSPEQYKIIFTRPGKDAPSFEEE